MVAYPQGANRGGWKEKITVASSGICAQSKPLLLQQLLSPAELEDGLGGLAVVGVILGGLGAGDWREWDR